MMSCIAEDVDTKHRINGALYSAIMEADKEKVLELCLKVSDHALHRITVNDDTVLHMATYAKEADLVLKLLDELPEHHLDKMTRQNGVGSTILHEAATNNYAIPIAEKLLKKAPGLLGMQLARHIANEYKQLIGEKDSDEMTALQLLACEPSAFKIDREEGFINLNKSKPKIHRYGGGGCLFYGKGSCSRRSSASTQGQKKIGETPLILATKSGCVEIAKEILRVYPQAVEHIDDEGRNVLHVALNIDN
ncbi:hypothetical protein GH714_021268 [Hevea brasiliensis]|uniref:PGG domain-containing protein n=1 Tax=Hevea brasiliensis TaxID=3981 RepID=A0A6A6LU81_HEVBR|nr:hypothetical protein GH714_021268 [Hevea brasiliensis]